jgi:hypothetical protein
MGDSIQYWIFGVSNCELLVSAPCARERSTGGLRVLGAWVAYTPGKDAMHTVN